MNFGTMDELDLDAHAASLVAGKRRDGRRRFRPCTDAADWWRVIQKMNENGCDVNIEIYASGGACVDFVTYDEDHRQWISRGMAKHPAIGRAVVVAALRASEA